MDKFLCVSPLDYRYYGDNERVFDMVNAYLSEQAMVKYMMEVELAVIKAFVKHNVCHYSVEKEVKEAVRNTLPEEIYEEDKKINHYSKSVVNVLQRKVSPDAARYIHLAVTSFDVVDTANVLRFRDFTNEVAIPQSKLIMKKLIDLASKEGQTKQIGRTHGQWAVPITLGFAICEYIERLGSAIVSMQVTSNELRGQMSGAVGAYNAMSLIVKEPVSFECDVMANLNLEPARHSIQVVPPEPVLDLVYSYIKAFGILANMADDFRHLQRSEIGELREGFGENQEGSSTMPHKRNPWNFEHVKSQWKEFMPRIMTCFMDQITEHQRDLTNSASGRYIPEIMVGYIDVVDRLQKQLIKLQVDVENIEKNFKEATKYVSAEPLYILLALAGMSNAHKYVLKKANVAYNTGDSLYDIVTGDMDIQKYLVKINESKLQYAEHPERYVGWAHFKVAEVVTYWDQYFFEDEEMV